MHSLLVLLFLSIGSASTSHDNCEFFSRTRRVHAHAHIRGAISDKFAYLKGVAGLASRRSSDWGYGPSMQPRPEHPACERSLRYKKRA